MATLQLQYTRNEFPFTPSSLPHSHHDGTQHCVLSKHVCNAQDASGCENGARVACHDTWQATARDRHTGSSAAQFRKDDSTQRGCWCCLCVQSCPARRSVVNWQDKSQRNQTQIRQTNAEKLPVRFRALKKIICRSKQLQKQIKSIANVAWCKLTMDAIRRLATAELFPWRRPEMGTNVPRAVAMLSQAGKPLKGDLACSRACASLRCNSVDICTERYTLWRQHGRLKVHANHLSVNARLCALSLSVTMRDAALNIAAMRSTVAHTGREMHTRDIIMCCMHGLAHMYAVH